MFEDRERLYKLGERTITSIIRRRLAEEDIRDGVGIFFQQRASDPAGVTVSVIAHGRKGAVHFSHGEIAASSKRLTIVALGKVNYLVASICDLVGESYLRKAGG